MKRAQITQEGIANLVPLPNFDVIDFPYAIGRAISPQNQTSKLFVACLKPGHEEILPLLDFKMAKSLSNNKVKPTKKQLELQGTFSIDARMQKSRLEIIQTNENEFQVTVQTL